MLHRRDGLALDSEYRNRYQLYHLADGTVADSREINWRQVAWQRVIKVESHIVGHKHVVECTHPDFRFFMVFRWFGQEWVKGERRSINLWTQGWSDGVRAFLVDLDFKTGDQISREYVEPLAKFLSHVHPAVWHLTQHSKQAVGTIIER